MEGGEALAQLGNDATMLSQNGLDRWLRARLRDGIPGAVVRFGDAEAKLLKAAASDLESMRDVTAKLRKETGLPLSPEEVLEIRQRVSAAYDEADVLGILPRPRFTAEHKQWLNWLLLRYKKRVERGQRPPVPLASCLLSHDILDDLPHLLVRRPVSVVSCRNVRPVLEAQWGLDEVRMYQVPSQFSVRDVDGAYEEALHDVPIWPDAHARVRAEITVREPGEVFLVGAGLFGKDLCIEARRAGAIAFDMGSALDLIAGKITRGPERRVRDLRAGGMSVSEIAAHLQDLHDVPVSSDDVLDVIARVNQAQKAHD